jgi:hypothetical protein
VKDALPKACGASALVLRKAFFVALSVLSMALLRAFQLLLNDNA